MVDKLKAKGISVILGTPSVTPPNLLYNKYPDMAVINPSGTVTSHGERRHCCSSNPNYIRESLRIVEKLAQEFGKDENVIGWQIIKIKSFFRELADFIIKIRADFNYAVIYGFGAFLSI